MHLLDFIMKLLAMDRCNYWNLQFKKKYFIRSKTYSNMIIA